MKVSWTRLNMYQTCKLQHHLHYVLNIWPPKDESPFFTGNLVHDTVKAWAEAAWLPDFVRPFAAKIFKERVKELRLKTAEEARDLYLKGLTGVLSAEHIYRALRIPEHDPIIEPRFTTPVAGGRHTVNGGFDVYDPVTKALYDMKLYSSDDTEGNPDQLRTYALMLRASGKVVEQGAFIYPLRTAEVSARTITDADLDDREREISETIDRMTADAKTRPEATVGYPHCLWCAFHKTRNCPATNVEPVLEPKAVGAPHSRAFSVEFQSLKDTT